MKSFFQKLNISGRLPAKLLDKCVLIFSHDILALFAAMHLSMRLILKDEMQLLDPGFVLKESMIFALIASGFFLWFQTYKGVWRYISWRQSVLLVGVLGFSSLIFFPLLTKAHMQPISISPLVVLVNWIVASCLLIGSRLFFRIFHERWTATNESLLTDAPTARILLVGSGKGAKRFLKGLKCQKRQFYEVLGCVETSPELDGSVEGIDVLGSLADLPDIIENFNSEGLHPHHIVFTDTEYYGARSRSLLKNLTPFEVSFMKTQRDSTLLVPMAIEDIFHEQIGGEFLGAFAGKNVLIYGASSALGEAFSRMMIGSHCGQIILWDQNTKELSRFSHEIPTEKVIFFSKASCDEEQLASYLKDHQVDVFINLKVFAALEVEKQDPSLSFEVYVEENERFAAACQKAGVENYYFITQESPHGALATQLSPVANHLLQVHSQKSNATYVAVNLPYILSNEDHYFQGGESYKVAKNEFLIATPAYGAHILGKISSAILSKTPWTGAEKFKMETISYEDLAEIYSRLNHNAPKSTYTMKSSANTAILWNDGAYEKVQNSLKRMDYKAATMELSALFKSA